MLIYIIGVILILLLFKFLTKNKALVLSFIILFIISALRKYTVGIDTKQYVDQFLKIGEMSFPFTDSRYEFGFDLLNNLLFKITSNPQILIIVTSLIINSAVCYFIYKNSNNFLLSTLLFIFLSIYFNYMNVTRQAIAISVLLFGYSELKEGHTFRYLLFIIAASMFHSVALLALIFILLKYINFDISFIVFLVFSALFCFVFGKQIFNLLTIILGKYDGYLETEFGQSNYFGSLLSFLQDTVLVLLCSYSCYSQKVKNNNILETKLVSLYLVFLFLVMRINLFNRLSGLLSIYMINFIPNKLHEIKLVNKKEYHAVLTLILLISIGSFITINLLKPEWNGCSNFQFFWEV